LLVLIARRQWIIERPNRNNIVEMASSLGVQSNHAPLLSRIAKVDMDLFPHGGPSENHPGKIEGITNTYNFSSNHVVTRVVIPNPEFKIFGTPEFESLAKAQFEKLTIKSKYIVDPNLFELKAVLEDFPAAKDSQLLYSGIYQSAITTSTLAEVRQLIFNTRYRAVRDLEEANAIIDVAERESKIQQIREMAGAQITLYKEIQQETLDDARKNLIKLYGDLPKPIFQRLLSIELRQPMGRLPYP
jgi:hypothetical protein